MLSQSALRIYKSHIIIKYYSIEYFVDISNDSLFQNLTVEGTKNCTRLHTNFIAFIALNFLHLKCL